MCMTPVLVVPDFTKYFALECDASRIGLGTILTQEGRPLAFIGKQLCDKNLGNSTYEKEMMAILHAVDTWRAYLIGKHFQIKTAHQVCSVFWNKDCPPQNNVHKWVTNM